MRSFKNYGEYVVASLRVSFSEYANSLASQRAWLVSEFARHVEIKPWIITSIASAEAEKAEKLCRLVFPYGWLSPDAKFFTTGISRHEDTVKEVTGYCTPDEACSAHARWIKLSAGLPVYTHRGEILTYATWGMRRVTNRQKDWFDIWMEQVSEGPRRLYFFNV